MKKTVRKVSTINALKKAGEKAKLKSMTKEERTSYKAGKRNAGSDSEYSYRSIVSAGGTRHVKRRRKREDGTYRLDIRFVSFIFSQTPTLASFTIRMNDECSTT